MDSAASSAVIICRNSRRNLENNDRARRESQKREMYAAYSESSKYAAFFSWKIQKGGKSLIGLIDKDSNNTEEASSEGSKHVTKSQREDKDPDGNLAKNKTE